MWPVRLELRRSSIDAMVVLLPEPVAPTTSTRPRFSITISERMGGRFSVSSAGISVVMKRMTTASEPRCWKADRRKRPTPDTPKPLFSSRSATSASNSSVETISDSRLLIIPLSITCWLMGMAAPLTLRWTGDPTAMKRSDAFFSAISLNRRSIAMMAILRGR